MSNMVSGKLVEQFTMFWNWSEKKNFMRKESRLGVGIERAYDSLKKDNRDLGAEAPSVRFLFLFYFVILLERTSVAYLNPI